MASFLLIVKTAVFTSLYLGLWCEHKVETSKGVAGQHVQVVISLRELVCTKLRSMAYGAVWKTTLSFLIIIIFL